ncbi:MAG: hypothetical protein PHT91_01020 [Candidatus Nanoarchaeia archaeon]|nr:hypothetical protein [Candidatus Nanoarchaeia archaeon]MDD5054618.1 hypothetical protein [Candidatus Nanoarchaeia archaeon]MDD5499441.1 hypothetical protein [Candidatus Nanoarchaeia archaeon]
MNEQFSMLYSLLFLSAMLGSFAALRAGIDYWGDYQEFIIDSNELVCALQLASYFDDYEISLSFEKMLGVIADESIILVSRDSFSAEFSGIEGLFEAQVDSDSIKIIKTAEGVGII